jgi:prepilin-type N-terminal cleavage/methylation domain-containing protein
MSKTMAQHRRGFSLAELMIAIGIMGVGITMVATIFPTALKQNELSNNDCMGMLIAENGMAMAKGLVDESNMKSTYISPVAPNPPLQLAVVADATHGDPNHFPIAADQQQFPTWPPRDPNDTYPSFQGYVVLARKMSADPDEHLYQLVTVSYAKRGSGTVVRAKQLVGLTITGTALTITPTPASDLVVGSPLITDSGKVARIIEADQAAGKATLENATLAGALSGWVIVEESGGSNAAKSPANTVVVSQTELK